MEISFTDNKPFPKILAWISILFLVALRFWGEIRVASFLVCFILAASQKEAENSLKTFQGLSLKMIQPKTSSGVMWSSPIKKKSIRSVAFEIISFRP